MAAISAAAVAAAAATAYPVINMILSEVRAPKIAELRKRLNQILNKYNVKISDLQKQMEVRGIKYAMLMDKLSGVSPSGTARKIADLSRSEYTKSTNKDLETIRDLQHESSQYSAIAEAEISKLENKGAINTIIGGIQNK